MKSYKSVFFDLDHTLWDYETNSRETLLELYSLYKLVDRGVHAFDAFFNTFRKVNLSLWDLYDRGLLDSETVRKERFKQILTPFNAYDEAFATKISDDYLSACPKKKNLLPDALETLDYLSGKYQLTIVTNGFEEIQNLKMTSGNLHQYFKHIITSQKAGYRKPSAEIFHYALKVNGVNNTEAIMIGDNLVTDIGGAKNASIDAVLFNPDSFQHDVEVHYEIRRLHELKQIL
jgi:putative hydrolase of the HAD superfamily